jgi:RNA polymerase sigma factor (sigma-70 family)
MSREALAEVPSWCHILDGSGVYNMRGKLKMTLPLVDRLRSWAAPVPSEADGALEDAIDEHWSSVCETVYYLVGDWEEAQDLALETFWRFHTRASRGKGNLSNLGGWLYRTATNLGLNAIRARRRRERYEEAAGALRLQRADPVDPAEEVERRQEKEKVRHVLSHMKAAQGATPDPALHGSHIRRDSRHPGRRL